MPILKKQLDVFPGNLLESGFLDSKQDCRWWSCYTLARQEKKFMQKLAGREIPFYGPTIPKRYRSPAGRIRTSYIPLFANYVFVLADEKQRIQVLETGSLRSCNPVVEVDLFLKELRQIQQVIEAGVEILPEATLQKGDKVRVLNGSFAGYEGVVIRRGGGTRLLLTLNFLEQGVSIELDNCQIAKI